MRRLILSWAVVGLAMLPPAAAFGSDQEVAQQIANNLKNSGRMKGYSINVKVQEGIVQLDGTVRTEQQLEQALAIAEVTPGIERVLNNLRVKESAPAAVAPGRQRTSPAKEFQPPQPGGPLADSPGGGRNTGGP